ncbi:MAG TPA: sigma-70 family RNA polymerase sigma factor [Polyangiaceae bacterium]|nr:sigma-70 family RNA polymerase sigma factor [Polyangiaceae bacterium]
MREPRALSSQFEQHRARLRAVAYRMLGSSAEADDAVQEVWLRLSRSDAGAVENLGGWLTTVVARVCLDLLRSRKSRREESLDDDPPESGEGRLGEGDAEREALLADAVGPALLVVLEALAPAERLAFVLHDMFAVPFEEIAPLVGRSPTAARQLASRARRRVQGAAPAPDPARARRREVVAAFLAAARDGNFDALLAVLDPEVVLRADDAAVALGSAAELRGAPAVARTFSGRARDARPALVDGAAGAVWVPPGGRPRVVFEFTIEDDTIVAIDLRADRARLAGADLIVFDG